MKKQAALRILLPILLANIVVFILPFIFISGANSPVNSADPLQVKLQVGAIVLLVLNVSILLAFMIYRKMQKKPKALSVFLLTLGIFIAEAFLLFRNMTQYDAFLSQNVFGMSSFMTSLLLFVFFNISAAYVIARYTKRKIEPKK
ncbi:MAG: hypothetical protein WBL80_07800 [Erysipelotrichaceae bacterium]